MNNMKATETPIRASWVLNKSELKEYLKYCLDLSKIRFFTYLASSFLGIITFAIVFLISHNSYKRYLDSIAISVIFAVIITIVMIYTLRHGLIKNSNTSESSQKFLHASSDLEIDNDFIRQSIGLDTFIHSWKNIIKIDETKNLLLLFKSPNTAIIIPKRAFGEENKILEAILKIKKFYKEAIDN